MKGTFSEKYEYLKPEIDAVIVSFDNSGRSIKDSRNKLKIFELEEFKINVKSFKVPNLVNKVVYNFFRKGKAQRSFEYAKKLHGLGVKSPDPIAYYQKKTLLFFERSYYVSKQLDFDFSYRHLTKEFDVPDYENILRAFTRFTYKLHENNVHFLDHSPGNTLIKRTDKGYEFYLVDLNRMEFKSLDFDGRIKNFSRLTIHKSMVETMSDEYAKCIGEDYQKVFNLMWRYTNEFQEKYHRKKRLKETLKFSKK